MTLFYNQGKEHPRPECYAYASNSISDTIAPVKFNAIADTGADMTMIPKIVIDSLGNLIEGEGVIFEDSEGNEEFKKTYVVNIRIGKHDYPGIEVTWSNKNHGLIGRDILNRNKASFNSEKALWKLNCSEICPKV